MSREMVRNKMIATAGAVLALGGVAACGGGKETTAQSQQPAPSKSETCDGLPPYQVVGHLKDGNPLLQFQKDENCTLHLYDEHTLRDIGSAVVDKSSTFFACYDGDKPERIQATLASAGHIGATGEINLGDAAAVQLAADQDIPSC